MPLRAKDIMDPNVLTVDAQSDVLSCARLMVDHAQGYAVVTGGEHPISGILTEWDVIEKVVAAGRNAAEIHAGELASAPVVTCDVATPMDELVARMVEKGIRRIIVTRGDHVVGIITSKGVLAMFRRYVDQICSDMATYQSSETATGI